MSYPSNVGGATTRTVGFFAHDCALFADWLVDGLGPGMTKRASHVRSIDDVTRELKPSLTNSRYICVPFEGWTLFMNNTVLGTDVGVLPKYAVRELGCRAIRAVRVEKGEHPYPARILEVFGPQGEPPLMYERTISAANDGGRWVFETSGTPFPFEDTAAYSRRLKSNRFTGEMLLSYLEALGVPVHTEPDWRRAITVEREDAV